MLQIQVFSCIVALWHNRIITIYTDATLKVIIKVKIKDDEIILFEHVFLLDVHFFKQR